MITCTWMMIALCFWVDCHVSCLKDTEDNELIAKASHGKWQGQADSTCPLTQNFHPQVIHPSHMGPYTKHSSHSFPLASLLLAYNVLPAVYKLYCSCKERYYTCWDQVKQMAHKLYKATTSATRGGDKGFYWSKPAPSPETNMLSQPPKDIITACDVENKRLDN